MEPMIRELDYNDDVASYINLLSQLTSAPAINYTEFINHLEIIKKNQFHKIFIMIVENKIIGSGTLLIEPKFIHGISYVGHIEDIVIDDQYRGKKYGTILLNYLVTYAKKSKCYKIILDCSRANVNFYEKIGLSESQVQMSMYFKNE